MNFSLQVGRYRFKIDKLHKKLISKDELKDVLANVFDLINIYLICTIPPTVEGSFSTMKRIKTIKMKRPY